MREVITSLRSIVMKKSAPRRESVSTSPRAPPARPFASYHGAPEAARPWSDHRAGTDRSSMIGIDGGVVHAIAKSPAGVDLERRHSTRCAGLRREISRSASVAARAPGRAEAARWGNSGTAASNDGDPRNPGQFGSTPRMRTLRRPMKNRVTRCGDCKSIPGEAETRAPADPTPTIRRSRVLDCSDRPPGQSTRSLATSAVLWTRKEKSASPSWFRSPCTRR